MVSNDIYLDQLQAGGCVGQREPVIAFVVQEFRGVSRTNRNTDIIACYLGLSTSVERPRSVRGLHLAYPLAVMTFDSVLSI
jgi:hypothetical protein